MFLIIYTISNRLKFFKTNLRTLFDEAHGQPLDMAKVITHMNEKRPIHENVFEGGEVAAAISKMSDDNEVMYVDGQLFSV